MAAADTVSVLVVGGGIAGITAAVALAERGAAVTLVEQGRLGDGASGRNTGTLMHQSEPLVEAMLAASVAAYRELDDGAVDFGLRRHRQLLLARDERQSQAVVGKHRERVAAGVPAERLSGSEVAAAFPYLADAEGGLLVEEAYVVEAEPALHAFAARARRAGAELRTGVRVLQVLTEGGSAVGVLTDEGTLSADVVVLATGPWLADVLPGAPVGAGRGWLLRTERLPFALDTIVEELSWPDQDVLGLVGRPRQLQEVAYGRSDAPLADAVVLCPQRGGEALIGAAMTYSLRDLPEGADLPARIAARALDAAPGLATVGIRRAWSGLRPTAPDGLPLVGPVPGVQRLYLHGGHASLGMQAAPATAAWLADSILGATTPPPLAQLHPGRFGWEPSQTQTRLEAR